MERVELKGEYSDFIGTYHNVYDSKFCDGVVRHLIIIRRLMRSSVKIINLRTAMPDDSTGH